jgi:hypothetical protein
MSRSLRPFDQCKVVITELAIISQHHEHPPLRCYTPRHSGRMDLVYATLVVCVVATSAHLGAAVRRSTGQVAIVARGVYLAAGVYWPVTVQHVWQGTC